MVSDCGPGCEESRTTYSLEVERECDGVRLYISRFLHFGERPIMRRELNLNHKINSRSDAGYERICNLPSPTWTQAMIFCPGS